MTAIAWLLLLLAGVFVGTGMCCWVGYLTIAPKAAWNLLVGTLITMTLILTIGGFM